MAPIYRTVRSHDGHVELEEIKDTCKKHEELCQQFSAAVRELQQNDAQLEILGETAAYLRKKHEQVRRNMRERTLGEKELTLLEEEIALIDKQVCIWMKELEEINENRLQIEIRFMKLGNELKKSVTCVQLASIDFELIQMRHKERWQKFLTGNGFLDSEAKMTGKLAELRGETDSLRAELLHSVIPLHSCDQP